MALIITAQIVAAPSDALASSIHATAKAPTGTKCTLAYSTFEATIPHIDLEHCPDGETSDKVFCRAKTGYDEIVVYKFSAEGHQCLISTKAYDMDHFKLTIFDFVTKDD